MESSSASASASRTFPVPLSEKFKPQLKTLCGAVSPSVVAVLSYFGGAESREIPHSARRGTGVFVEPRLVLTSAHLIGRVSTVHDSDSGSTLHNCFLARTVALTPKEKMLCTTPVAVNFASDLAVLKVLIPRSERKSLPPPCAVAKATANDNRPLLGIVRHQNCSILITTMPGIRRKHGSGRPKAPWPMGDDLEWVHYGAGERSGDVIAAVTDIYGSPWFNFRKEVVGVASWAADVGNGLVYSYAVPPPCIKSVLNYANTKGPNDPIVMDHWINTVHTAPDHTLPIVEECVPCWPNNIVFQTFVVPCWPNNIVFQTFV